MSSHTATTRGFLEGCFVILHGLSYLGGGLSPRLGHFHPRRLFLSHENKLFSHHQGPAMQYQQTAYLDMKVFIASLSKKMTNWQKRKCKRDWACIIYCSFSTRHCLPTHFYSFLSHSFLSTFFSFSKRGPVGKLLGSLEKNVIYSFSNINLLFYFHGLLLSQKQAVDRQAIEE